MKKAGRTFVVLGVGILLGGCASDVPADFGETQAIGEASQALEQNQTDICHYSENGAVNLITIGEAAVEAHLAHGDEPVSPETCGCVEVRMDCDPFSDVIETVCGSGTHELAAFTAENISYVTFGPGVHSVTLIHCEDGSALSGAELTLTSDTNLCDLQGGCCGDPRWNDSVCSITIK